MEKEVTPYIRKLQLEFFVEAAYCVMASAMTVPLTYALRDSILSWLTGFIAVSFAAAAWEYLKAWLDFDERTSMVKRKLNGVRHWVLGDITFPVNSGPLPPRDGGQ